MKSEEYISKLISQIRYEKVHPMIEEEIRQHIEDEKEKYIKFGKSETEAEELAVKQMGDPVDAGRQLDEVHRPAMAWDVIVMAVVAAGIGLLVQFILMNKTDVSSFMPSPASGMVTFIIALAVMMGICMIDYTHIGKYAKPAYLCCVGILFLIEVFTGGGMNATIGMLLDVPEFFNVRPYYFILLLIPLYGGIIYGYRGSGWKGLLKSILWAIPYMTISILSLGMPVIIISWFSCGFLIILAVVKNWFTVPKKLVIPVLGLGIVSAPVVGFYVLYLLGRGYQRARIDAWLHPFQVDADHAYNRFVPEFINHNRWIGMNPLITDASWSDKLPVGNDYSFTYLAAYYGIAVALVVAMVIGVLFVRSLHISIGLKNPMGMMMAAGASVTLLLEFVFSVLVNLLVIPSSGYCPFITYGGSGMMVTGVLLGVLLSVYRHQNVVDETKLHGSIPF